MNKLFSATIKIFLLAALIALAGCNLPVKDRRTPTPGSMVLTSTVAAAQTEAAQSVYQKLTQSAALTPSATLQPTPTETSQPTPTKTSLPTPTKTSQPTVKITITQIIPTATKKITATKKPEASPTSNAYKCAITSLNPLSGASITKGSNFDLKVTFRNDGTETWKPTTVDFIYLSGPKFQKSSDVIKLPTNVLPGQSVNLLVDMAANSAKGTQNINWGLEQATGALFCYVGVTVIIK
jgi:Ig-like domain from next to BRCA1 gene